LPVPPGACDCHAHVFGPAAQFPYAEGRDYTPPDAPPAAHLAMLDALGLARGVLVQPSVYRIDNRAMWAALEAAPARLRAVAVIGEETGGRELERMHALGTRGVRFNVLSSGGTSLELLERLARRIAPLGWHVQLHVAGPVLAELAPRLGRLPVAVVIDHMGNLRPEAGPAQPGFQALLALLRDGAWVKLSAPYRLSREPAPFAAVIPFARALAEAAPERCLWGTDWPHPNLNDRVMPNDGDLLDALADWAPDAEAQRRILVENPARLYGFP
jgi:predicted TIM-barrel fold metal-dependent hydrolase